MWRGDPRDRRGRLILPRIPGIKHLPRHRALGVDGVEPAIVYARQLARREKAELYIHGRDGTIREKRSYADDPTPSRDKV